MKESIETSKPEGTAGQLPVELNPQQAISVLIQAVNFAQSKGVYSLEDAEILSRAVKVFVKKEPAATTPETTTTPETVTAVPVEQTNN